MDIDSFRDMVVYNFGYSANDDTVDYIANELGGTVYDPGTILGITKLKNFQ